MTSELDNAVEDLVQGILDVQHDDNETELDLLKDKTEGMDDHMKEIQCAIDKIGEFIRSGKPTDENFDPWALD